MNSVSRASLFGALSSSRNQCQPFPCRPLSADSDSMNPSFFSTVRKICHQSSIFFWNKQIETFLLVFGEMGKMFPWRDQSIFQMESNHEWLKNSSPCTPNDLSTSLALSMVFRKQWITLSGFTTIRSWQGRQNSMSHSKTLETNGVKDTRFSLLLHFSIGALLFFQTFKLLFSALRNYTSASKSCIFCRKTFFSSRASFYSNLMSISFSLVSFIDKDRLFSFKAPLEAED